jgi:hypothetical protein
VGDPDPERELGPEAEIASEGIHEMEVTSASMRVGPLLTMSG